MWRAFQRYRALEPESRRLFWCALQALLLISISLRMRGFNATRDRLQHKLLRDRQEHPDLSVADIVRRTCRMAKAAAHYGWLHPTCLESSLTLWYLLQKQSVFANLRIGVRKTAGKFEAHAWVEYQGTALNDDPEVHQHYAAFGGEFAGFSGEKM